MKLAIMLNKAFGCQKVITDTLTYIDTSGGYYKNENRNRLRCS